MQIGTICVILYSLLPPNIEQLHQNHIPNLFMLQTSYLKYGVCDSNM